MEFKHNFNEICQSVPFTILLQHLQTPFKIDGKTIKTDEIIVTIDKMEKDGYKFDQFFWKNKVGQEKGGGSVLDYAQACLHLKSKTQTAQWLKTNILGEKEQREDIPVLNLSYDPFFDKLGILEKTCQDYGAGLVKGNSVMSGRICFKLTDHTQKHRGYTGFDHTKTKKVLWYVPQGTKVSDMLYNYNRKNGNDYCILVSTPIEALYMCSIGFNYTLGMLTPSLTAQQLELMKAFKRVIVISPIATTTAIRLTPICFVKCIETGVMGKSYEEIKNLF